MVPLDGYRYHGRLGLQGHFGEVYLAENILSGETVAIKHVDGGKLFGSLEAWSAEARAMAACDHKNLVKIKHAVVTPSGPVLVMEFLEDGSWDGKFGGRPAPVATVMDLGIDLCWGLHHLHGRGLVHRDIKPGNVLLRAGSGVLGDFGISGVTGTTPDLHYFPQTPPEARTWPMQWTPQADIYALGVTLYRMLCGDEFCGFSSLDPSDETALGRWPDTNRWPLHVHRPLRRALRDAMHAEVSKRPQSAQRLREVLQRCRPLVSLAQTGPLNWIGTSANDRWRVDLQLDGTGLGTLAVFRDKGNGFRAVKAASIAAPTKEPAAVSAAEQVLNNLACTGTPVG